LCREFVGAAELGDDGQSLVAGEDSGGTFASFGTGEEGLDVLVQDVAVEEEDRAGEFWVEAATFLHWARWASTVWISGAPISLA
jgi:hypothetical protein